MEARLFFAMLNRGRAIEGRRQFRTYYHLLNVSTHPHNKEDSQKEIRQFYWDNSLSDIEIAMRDSKIAEIKKDAAKHYAPPEAALGFFRQART
jgi:hypothetical protein